MRKNTLSLNRLLHDRRLTLADRAHLEYFAQHGVRSPREQEVIDRIVRLHPPCRKHIFVPAGIAGVEEYRCCKVCSYIPTRDVAKLDRHLRTLEAERLEVQQ